MTYTGPASTARTSSRGLPIRRRLARNKKGEMTAAPRSRWASTRGVEVDHLTEQRAVDRRGMRRESMPVQRPRRRRRCCCCCCCRPIAEEPSERRAVGHRTTHLLRDTEIGAREGNYGRRPGQATWRSRRSTVWTSGFQAQHLRASPAGCACSWALVGGPVLPGS